MGYAIAGTADVDSALDPADGGLWCLRDALSCERLDVTILELEPEAHATTCEYEAGDEQVYVVVEGEVEIELAEETVILGPSEAIRLSPDRPRRVVNRTDRRARLVLVGAPPT